MKKKILCIVCMLLCALFAIGACAPAGVVTGDDDEDDGRTRLYVSVYKAGFGIDWLTAIAAEYEKENTDIKVVPQGDATMEGTAQAAIESGEGTRDIYSLTSSANYYNNSVFDEDGDGYSDRLACLDELYQMEIENGKTLEDLIDPNFKNIVQINGHYYGVPWNAAVTGIMYNYNMFKEKGWNVPTTMDEFYALCDTIRGAGIAPLGYCGGIADGYLFNLFAGLYTQYAGETNLNEFLAFESAEVYKQEARLKAYEAIGRMLTGTTPDGRSWILDGAQGMDHLAVQRAFIRGECAMLIGGSWLKTEMSAYLEEYPNFECAMMPLPWINPEKSNPDGTKNGNLSDATVLVVPKNAAHKDQAIDFLRFMSTSEMLKLYTEKTGGNPRPFTYEGVDYSDLDVWGKSLMDIYLSSTNYYGVSYVENFRLGRLKLILASDGTLVDAFNTIGPGKTALQNAQELVNSDYTIAQQYFSI